MSVADIGSRYQSFIIPDLGTIHHKPLTQSIKDIHELLDEVERLREFEPKGGQQVGPSVGLIASLKQENRDLKRSLATAHDAIRISNVMVEDLQSDVAWLETPMRARHKALLAAAEEAMKHFEFQGHSPNCPEAKELRKTIAECRRDGP